MRFRKKPVVVEAVQLGSLGSGPPPSGWFDEAIANGKIEMIVQGSQFPIYAEIATPEGRMLASGGDWIIRGVAGEVYPCKPEIFDQTYEPVVDAVIDTWAGNWIVRVDAPNGLFAEHMLDKDAMEVLYAPSESISRTAISLFADLWRRRNEEKADG